MLDSNNKSNKLNDVAPLELYRDSWVLSSFWEALIWLLLVSDFERFFGIIISSKIVDNESDIVYVCEN